MTSWRAGLAGWSVAVIVIVTTVGTVVTTRAAGWWTTESTRTPRRIETGVSEGSYDPADIRGSYTLQDVADTFRISIPVLIDAFNLRGVPNVELFRAGDLEATYGELPMAAAHEGTEDRVLEVGTDSLRLFVARYAGIEYEPEEDTGILAVAVDILTTAERITAEERAALVERIVVSPERVVVVTGDEAPADEAPADEAEEIHIDGDATIRGNTTFGEVLAWGVGREQIDEITGGEPYLRTEAIRDWAFDRGLSYSTIREQLQNLIDDEVD